MLGMNLQKDAWLLDIEAYYRNSENSLLHVNVENGFDLDNRLPDRNQKYLLIAGSKNVIGFDMTLRYVAKMYESWISYTWSKSQSQYDELFGGDLFPSVDDRRHQISWTQLIDAGQWQFSAVTNWASGNPFLPLPDPSRERNRQLRSVEEFERLPAYLRIDLNADYQFQLGDTPAFAGISLINLTDHANVAYRQQTLSLENMDKRLSLSNELLLQGFNWNVSFGLSF